MKKLFFTLVALVCATMSYAQNILVATLTHGDSISMYYGTYALRDALAAAEDGDVINLSGGSFQSTGIKKAVIIRGTGIDDANPTYISGDYTIEIPEESNSSRLTMEGIRCTGTTYMQGFENPLFLKCQFYRLYFNRANANNASFINCKVTDEAEVTYYASGIAMQFVNSIINDFKSYNTDIGSFTFINSILISSAWACSYSYLLNCIVCSPSSNYLPSTSVATNCIGIRYNIFSGSPSNTGCGTSTYEELFKDFTGTYSDKQTFELTDEAKTKYLGNDGTQVGWYGGVKPYTSTPSYPQITKMNVANKTTTDGKLSVEIEVSAAAE